MVAATIERRAHLTTRSPAHRVRSRSAPTRYLVLHLLLVGVGAELGGMRNGLTQSLTSSRELKLEIRLSDSHSNKDLAPSPGAQNTKGAKGEAAGVDSNYMLPTPAAKRPIALG